MQVKLPCCIRSCRSVIGRLCKKILEVVFLGFTLSAKNVEQITLGLQKFHAPVGSQEVVATPTNADC